MYNHARTLLLNIAGSVSTFDDTPGDELIPGTYRQLELPTYLDTFRARIFGVKPDRAMLNYRAAQLLTLLEKTELQQYVLDLDPRITYSTADLHVKSRFEPKVIQYAGDSNSLLTLKGRPISPDISGVSKYDFRVEIAGGDATVTRLTWPTVDNVTPITLTDNLSQVIDLPYSGYGFCVNSVNPAAWTIRGYLRPTSDLSQIVDVCSHIGEPYLLQLFGAASPEPYRTFKNCWEKHPDLAYRLGGLVLAMIYRTEEIRNG